MAKSYVIVDLENFKDTRSARVDPGRYRFQIEDVEIKATNATKNLPEDSQVKMVVAYLRILEGEFKGKTIIDRMTLSEGAMFRMVNFMQALNIPTPKKRLRFDPSSVVGRQILADVADGKPYRDEISSEIKGYISLPKTSREDVEEFEDEFEEDEELSTDPTDYDEDEEPEKVEKSKAKRASKQKESSEDESGGSEDDDEELEDIEDLDL